MATTFYTKENLDLSSWFKVVDQDYLELIQSPQFKDWLQKVKSQQPSLLDVGCGSGRFPELLYQSSSTFRSLDVQYTYMDEAEYCCHSFKKNLSKKLLLKEEMQCSIEHANLDGKSYDMLWAIHSLYGLQPDTLETTLRAMVSALKVGGIGLIFAHAQDSFYQTFINTYIQAFTPNRPAYLTGDEIFTSLQNVHEQVSCFTIHSTHEIDVKNHSIIETYLSKNAFYKMSYEQWLANKKIKSLLSEYVQGDKYLFPQTIKLILFQR